MGSDVENYIFNSPGTITIKIESSQDPHSFLQYGTIVYKNPSSSNKVQNIANQSSSSGLISSLTIVYSVYVIVIGLPVALVIMVIFIKKGKI